MTPKRETRESIERALAEQRRNRCAAREGFDRMRERMERHIAEMRKVVEPAQFARMEAKVRDAVHKISVQMRRRRRRPGEGSMPALVEPPRGPRPLSGGAAAPLEFD